MRGLWQRGMSLIELMVAMVIGLIILAGLSQIFVSGRTAYTLQERVGDLQPLATIAAKTVRMSSRSVTWPRKPVSIALAPRWRRMIRPGRLSARLTLSRGVRTGLAG
jgi:prepilin-type N-terminal cleavage/methylation domain-containing protein